MKNNMRYVFLAIAITTATTTPNVVNAAPKSLELEEIIVTARRREEKLQDVPISITALDSTALERTKLERPSDLQYQVPSFSLTAIGARKDTLAPSLRGQRSDQDLGTSDAPVAFYFGDTLVARPVGANQTLFDVSQVQVLRGVQGTLFGRNTTGGALVIKPTQPEDTFNGDVKVTLGNFDHKEVYGMVNLPLGETFAVRLAGTILDRDGLSENIETGQLFEDRDSEAWRVSLKWTPIENLESLTIYDQYQHDQNSATGGTLQGFNFSAPALQGYNQLAAAAQDPFLQSIFPTLESAFPDLNALLAEQQQLGIRQFRSSLGTGLPNQDLLGEPRSVAKHWGVQNTTALDVGNVTIKNIVAYRELESFAHQDLDGSLASLVEAQINQEYEFFSEEFQILGTAMEDSLDWIVGLYYLNEKGEDTSTAQQFNILNVEGARIGTFGAVFDGTNLADAIVAANAQAFAASALPTTISDVENTSYAAYLGLTYRMNDTWTIAGGLRHTTDEREYTSRSRTTGVNTGVETCDITTAAGVPLPIAQCSIGADESYNDLTYDATLSYTPNEETLLYGAFRHGYRAGGFTGRAFSTAELEPFDPEEVDEFELGFKQNLLFGGVPTSATGAIYYQDYTDIQRQSVITLSPTQFATVVRNAASGGIWGGEIELLFNLRENISLSAFYSYVDGEYDEFIDPGTGADRSDELLVTVSRNTYGATLNASHELDSLGSMVWTLNAYYQSRSSLDDIDPIANQESYVLLNGRVSLENIAGSSFSSSIWVRNITDEEYLVGTLSILESGAGIGSNFWGEPRTFGIDVSYHFGE